MQDIEILLANKPGELAHMGETLGKSKISLEGGGVFQNGEIAIAHYLVEEAERAKEELAKVQIVVRKINNVIIQKLRQDVPGQLGMFCRRMADANVNILTQYSDHSNQLIVVVDNYEKGIQVSQEWTKEWQS
ncbi:amino acid-binding ACT domain-containing protein [Ginsengibacter hankyongi]|uniref:Amino acid-binding ACT domain-containing protein n=1 Tax=Ginsengibacter hankyongi TaxID=2607284 RepID=A0A5J5IDY1_9BACT|nr:amino acid-binding ACT domain-containing protein [Ginsengibacter hankyongi]KAA9037231.1 amino acid-binding ACT domain-containing protein [Ginsengibacter hankyongi]